MIEFIEDYRDKEIANSNLNARKFSESGAGSSDIDSN